MIFNLPTALTWLRIVLIPVFVAVYYAPDEWLTPVMRNWIGMSVFALGAITDWFDEGNTLDLGDAMAHEAHALELRRVKGLEAAARKLRAADSYSCSRNRASPSSLLIPSSASVSFHAARITFRT